MKRAGRWLVNFVAAGSAVLCLILIVLGICSFWKVSSVAIDRRGGTFFWIEIERGHLKAWKQRRVAAATQPAPVLAIQSGEAMVNVRPKNVITSSVFGFGAAFVPQGPYDAEVANFPTLRQQADQMRDRVDAEDQSIRVLEANGEPADKIAARQAIARLKRGSVQRVQEMIDGMGARRYTVWQVSAPTWAVALGAALPAMLWLAARHRRNRHLTEGTCIVCGYDLRATPQRCPECGTKSQPNERTASHLS